MKTKNDEEKINVKIVSKTQALWEKVKKESEILIEQSEDNLKIQREMLKLAEKKIKEEKDNL